MNRKTVTPSELVEMLRYMTDHAHLSRSGIIEWRESRDTPGMFAVSGHLEYIDQEGEYVLRLIRGDGSMDPPELEGVPDDAKRFYRLIEERTVGKGNTTITLACGHEIEIIGGLPESVQYHLCPECLASGTGVGT